MADDTLPAEVPEKRPGRFFRPVDWSAFWTSCVIAFGVYFYTMAPTVGLEDSGELAVAGDYLGVPHPPGYPIWTIISWIFARIFSFVTFRGQPNPAWSITLVSVVFGAVTSGMTAMLISRSGTDLLGESRADSHTTNRRTDNLICWTGGVVGSLIFTFSPVMWSQSVIIEVYSLNAFFLVLVFLMTYWWMRKPSDKLLFITAFVFGLGLTNYQVLLLAALALVVVIMLRDVELFRDFLIVGILFILTITVMKLASMPPTPGFGKLPAFADPAYKGITSHTALHMHPGKYGWILAALTFVVTMSLVVRQRWKPGGAWPVAPAAALGIGIVVLLALLANVPMAPEIVPKPNQEVFSWARYYLGFLAAMAALILLCVSIPRGHMLAVAFVAIEVTLAVLLRKGALRGLYHPLSLWFTFYVFLNFLFLGTAWFCLPRGRTVALSFLMAEFGVAFYAFMPILSDLRNPPMNWAYPRTWEGFKHAITRGQYEKISPANAFSLRFVNQMGSYLTDLREQFTLPVALLGFLPFTVWQMKAGGRQIKALNVAITLSIAASIFVIIEKLLFPGGSPLTTVYKLLILGVVAILGAGGLALFISQVRELVLRLPGTSSAKMSERVTLALVLIGGLMLFMLYSAMLAMNIIDITDPLRAGAELSGPQVRTIIFQVIGLVGLIIVPVALAVLITWLMNSRHEFRVLIDHNSQQWVIATLVGFLAMSIVLIALANPKGDIQDSFIQRVKFISSHALYAFWIGYGLIFGLAFVDTLFRGKRSIKWLSIGTAMCLALIPIQQNIANKELIRKLGGAEQNGHDFGWQFGNYQLRGAEAISEELEPDEEPLPNPFFPPEMGADAIFFGGTDPGRFVPTYMIYSARVREDVYLITQNALADNTYMSVMRDLYGDQIWIPAQPDSAKAFQRYVDEVKSGKRRKNADLKIENGRVQVSGALGVMEINGILAQMIFEYNNYKNAFYVEESYVIPWMYPYLTPHGLIMKINPKKTRVDAMMTRNDQHFWDWYTRRLVSDTKFTRDIVARKSFSKLRSAIGGLYGRRRKLADAEEAFQQARILYPLSPEANFRLVQEVLMRQNRFAEALHVMESFGEADPGNVKVPQFLKHLDRIQGLTRQIRKLESKRKKGRMDARSALQLADLYRQANQKSLFTQMIKGILSTKNIDPRIVYEAALILHRAKDYDRMDAALRQFLAARPQKESPGLLLEVAKLYVPANRPDRMSAVLGTYLELAPNDWKAWLDQSALLLALRKTGPATEALEKALRIGGNEALSVVRQDGRFTPIRNKAIQQSQRLLGVPSSGSTTLPIPGLGRQ